MDEYITVECPHCKDVIVIYRKDIRCAIFRHGVYKDSMRQINPHSSKDVCDDLVKQDKVFGCAKPFRLVHNENKWNAIVCDYI